jgi:hypothetical protein
MNLDLLARSAAADLRESAARSLDIDAALAGLVRARHGRAVVRGVAVAVVLAATVLSTLAVLRPAAEAPPTDPAPSPTPSAPDTSPTEFPVRVPPLCLGQWPRLNRYGDPDLDGPAGCPGSTPAGHYASMIAGMNVARPFTFDLPDDWEVVVVDEWPTSGVDIRSVDRRAGLTVFPYAEPAGQRAWVSDLRHWLERRTDVRVHRRPVADLGGMAVWVIDLTPSAGARLREDCRLAAPCLPVVRAGLAEAVPGAGEPPTAVELRPGVWSRLFAARVPGDSELSPGVWLWDTGPGRRQDEARAVLRSIEMLSARGPMPPDSRP